jgi:hypothetical protein
MNIRTQMRRTPRTYLLAVVLPAAGITLAGIILSPARAWGGLLLAAFYILGLSLGAMVMLALHHVTKAGWSAVVRRVPEAMLAILPVAAAAILLTLCLGRHWLYPHHSQEEDDAALAAWRGAAFVLGRAAAYPAIWMLFAWALLRLSRRQDQSSDPASAHRSLRVSAAFNIAIAVTL